MSHLTILDLTNCGTPEIGLTQLLHSGLMMGNITSCEMGHVQKTGEMAKVFGMKIAALRRRTELSQKEKGAGLEVTMSSLNLPEGRKNLNECTLACSNDSSRLCPTGLFAAFSFPCPRHMSKAFSPNDT